MLFTIRRRSQVSLFRRAWEGLAPSIVVSTSRRMFICLFPGSRVTTDQRVVAKQEIQEVESAKRAGSPYAHHRYQARDTNAKHIAKS